MLGSARPPGEDEPGRCRREASAATPSPTNPTGSSPATAAGAGKILQGLHETDYGSRDFAVRDPEGNRWSSGRFRGEPRENPAA